MNFLIRLGTAHKEIKSNLLNLHFHKIDLEIWKSQFKKPSNPLVTRLMDENGFLDIHHAPNIYNNPGDIYIKDIDNTKVSDTFW